MDRSEVDERYMWSQCDCGACFQTVKPNSKTWDAEASMREALEHMASCSAAAEEKVAALDGKIEVVTTLADNVREFFDEKGWELPSRLEGPRPQRRLKAPRAVPKKDPRDFRQEPDRKDKV